MAQTQRNSGEACEKQEVIMTEKAKILLYISYLISRISAIGWQFSCTLVLVALTNYKSMSLISSYGLFNGLAVCLFGPNVGSIIDDKERDRLSTARLILWVQNLSVIGAVICCCFLLLSVPRNERITEELGIGGRTIESFAPPATWCTFVLLAILYILGAFETLSEQSMAIMLEYDWMVVMSNQVSAMNTKDDSTKNTDLNAEERANFDTSIEQDAEKIEEHSHLNAMKTKEHPLEENLWLSNTNTVMKQMDLAARVATPACFGYIFSWLDHYNTSSVSTGLQSSIPDNHWYHLIDIMTISALLNVTSLFISNVVFQRIYKLVPLLNSRNTENADMLTTPSQNLQSKPSYSNLPQLLQEEDRNKNNIDLECGEYSDKEYHKVLEENSILILRKFAVYFQQPISFGGLALSLLYLNILSFGTLMTAYLIFRGMSFDEIGLLRGISYSAGLLGTFAFGLSTKHLSLLQTGRWSIILQFCCLSLCYASLYVRNSELSLALLVGGVIASRIGLYVFDLTITQLMQQTIPEHYRGLIGGIQKSFNSSGTLITFGLGFLFSSPEQFWVLAGTGFASVGLAMSIYIWGSYKHKHIITI